MAATNSHRSIKRMANSKNSPSRLALHISEPLSLIHLGALPPADTLSGVMGEPAWTLSSIAKILGISRQDLVAYLEDRHGRFQPAMPVSSYSESSLDFKGSMEGEV